ncbi:MAG: Rieske 2Fe-2S domain-containing protein [Burkholderiaceae bacterium]
MTLRPQQPKTPYSAYSFREVPPEDAELTHVGPGTPCGEWMRRFWNPVAYSHEITDLPFKVRILGEDLVLFRDGTGRLGLLQAHCCHRGTSLEFGIVAERGLRCCYHGWLFDVDGTILEMPGEPAQAAAGKAAIYQGAYPVHEHQGVVFAYLGPPEKKPSFPMYDWWGWEGDSVVPGTRHYFPCNWLQVKENAMDPAHLSFLHTISSGRQFSPAFGKLPEVEYIETPNGMAYVTSRRIGDNVWVRMTEFLYPNIHQVPTLLEDGTVPHPPGFPRTSIWSVPVDDVNTVVLPILHVRAGDPAPVGLPFGQDASRSYEERQRQPGDYDAQIGQRPIARHALENLRTTDVGVVMLRRLIRSQIQAVQNGQDPKGVWWDDRGFEPTCANDTVIYAPAAPTADEDRELMRSLGRKVADEIRRDPTRHFHSRWTNSDKYETAAALTRP